MGFVNILRKYITDFVPRFYVQYKICKLIKKRLVFTNYPIQMHYNH